MKIGVSQATVNFDQEQIEFVVTVFRLNFFKPRRNSGTVTETWLGPKQGESHLDAMLRGKVLTALAVFGQEETQKEAIRRFDAFVADRNTSLPPPDLRRAAYVAVMQRANKSDKSGYESLLKVYRETDLSQEKTRILGN